MSEVWRDLRRRPRRSARCKVRGVSSDSRCGVTEYGADGPAQAFEFGEPGVVDGTTADSLAADRRGPRQDDQAVKTKLLTGSCLRILDQGLGPTRARSSRNRPLEPPGTSGSAGSRVGWTSLPHTPNAAHFTGTPAPDVDAPCLVTHWANRNLCLSSDSCLLE